METSDGSDEINLASALCALAHCHTAVTHWETWVATEDVADVVNNTCASHLSRPGPILIFEEKQNKSGSQFGRYFMFLFNCDSLGKGERVMVTLF